MKRKGLTQTGRNAERAMRIAVKKVIAEYKIKKLPLIIWENGKIVKLRLDKVPVVREKKAKYLK